MSELTLLNSLKFFFEHPYREVYLRQLAKQLDMSPFAAKKHMDLLVGKHLVLEERKANLRYFKANTGSLFFRHLKIAFNLSSILGSGLVEFLKESLPNISSIVLFGSMAKGEDDENSDVDVLVIGKEKRISLREFEEKFGRDINLHVLSWSEWNKKARDDKPFYLEILTNGIPLYGEKPVIS
jgi:predicted nucleotidyltransferase